MIEVLSIQVKLFFSEPDLVSENDRSQDLLRITFSDKLLELETRYDFVSGDLGGGSLESKGEADSVFNSSMKIPSSQQVSASVESFGE